jgi:SAM-dependent methyltransferase
MSEVTAEAVTWAYRFFLGREPETPDLVRHHVATASSVTELALNFMASREYADRQGSMQPALAGHEPANIVQTHLDIDADQSAALFAHVKRTWTHLGETDPYWAVLSSPEFRGLPTQHVLDRFYATGVSDVDRIRATLERNGLSIEKDAVALEYGSGLGRVTAHLGKMFSQVTGVDISSSMVKAAQDYAEREGLSNVKFLLLDQVTDIEQLPPVDFIYSCIVLQHSPPPIMSLIIESFMKALRPGGVAMFQIPTYLRGYSFVASEYLAGLGPQSHADYEVHALPQRALFDLLRRGGGEVLEVLPDGFIMTTNPGSMSNTVLVRKR